MNTCAHQPLHASSIYKIRFVFPDFPALPVIFKETNGTGWTLQIYDINYNWSWRDPSQVGGGGIAFFLYIWHFEFFDLRVY